MVGALKVLGVQLEEDWESSRLVVTGCAGRFPCAPGPGGGCGGCGGGVQWQVAGKDGRVVCGAAAS